MHVWYDFLPWEMHAVGDRTKRHARYDFIPLVVCAAMVEAWGDGEIRVSRKEKGLEEIRGDMIAELCITL